MFFISLPVHVKVGDTFDCRINKQPARVTYRDAKHLVIEPGDVRAIVTVQRAGDLNDFICGDAGNTAQDYDVHSETEGTVVSYRLDSNKGAGR